MSRITILCACLIACMFGTAHLAASDSVALSAPRSSAHVTAVYFYSADCSQCRHVSEKVLPRVKEKFAGRFKIEAREIHSIENFRLLLAMEKKHGAKIDKRPPVIFIGDDVLEGKDSIAVNIESAVEKYLGKEEPHVNVATEKSSDRSVVDEFRSLGILAVIAGGLLDGINPCAFATLIFLISYLAYAGRKGRDLIMSGVCYTAGVFAAYFGIGIGLFEFVRIFPAFETAGKVLMLFIAGGALALGALSVYDWVMIRRGRASEMKLQLNAFFKKKIHSSIRTGTRRSGIIVSSVIAGFLIGLFEFPCTGQVYFPIIIVIREMSDMRIQGILYLLLYNALFVLPLIVVFILVYSGLTSEQLAGFMKRRMALVKILTAVFFFLIAVLMILSVWPR